MSGPLLVNASQKRMRRLASWLLPLTIGIVAAIGCFPYQWGGQ